MGFGAQEAREAQRHGEARVEAPYHRDVKQEEATKKGYGGGWGRGG